MKPFRRFSRRELPVASSRRVMLVLMSVSTMFQFIYCCMLSSALHLLPIFGGAMFMSARVSGMLWRLLLGDERKYVTPRMRFACSALFIVILLCTIALIAVYPVLPASPAVWTIFALVLSVLTRETLERRLVGRKMRRTMKNKPFWLLSAVLYLASFAVAALALFLSLPADAAWQMLAGFGLGALLEIYGLWRGRDMIALEGVPDDIDAETVKQMAAELREVNAYSAYQRVHFLVLMALQVTLVLVYTFIGTTTSQLLVGMLLAVVCTIVMREAADLCLRRIKTPASTQMLLIGLFMWLYGLYLFYVQMDAAPDLLLAYVALCLSVSGLTVSVTALADLETRMTNVAQFKLQKQMLGYSQLRSTNTEMALTLGQMVALLLTVLCIPHATLQQLELTALSAALRPIMIVPPLLLVGAAVVSVLHFPMNNRYFAKLSHWLTLESEGKDNPALLQQLDSVMVKRHKNRFGVKIIVTILRPLYYHKVIGKENLQGYEDGSMILICNHGELYGPVVANLYVPVTFRPWVLADMMDEEAIIKHMYEGTMVRQRWLPEKWKLPLLRTITPLLIWVFDSLEAIPVYRGKPRELMRTFRDTIDAMQAGDNVLLFPENADEHEPGKSGFVRDGVGQLYTGFAMIAPLYYAKTKRASVFVPIYASKKRRTVTIGQGIPYDPTVNANGEKMRIVDELLTQMQRMADEEERLPQK